MLTYAFEKLFLINSLRESHTIGASLIPALAFCKSSQKFAFILDYYITMVSQLGSQMAQLQFGVWGSEHKLISQCIIILLDVLFHISSIILYYHNAVNHPVGCALSHLALSCIITMHYNAAGYVLWGSRIHILHGNNTLQHCYMTPSSLRTCYFCNRVES